MVYGFNRSTFVMTLILDWSSKQAFTAHLKTCHISSELVWKGLHQEEEQVVSFFFVVVNILRSVLLWGFLLFGPIKACYHESVIVVHPAETQY